MLQRTLEPEIMDSIEEADEYDAMDHDAVNQAFAEDFLGIGRRRLRLLGFGDRDGVDSDRDLQATSRDSNHGDGCFDTHVGTGAFSVGNCEGNGTDSIASRECVIAYFSIEFFRLRYFQYFAPPPSKPRKNVGRSLACPPSKRFTIYSRSGSP